VNKNPSSLKRLLPLLLALSLIPACTSENNPKEITPSVEPKNEASAPKSPSGHRRATPEMGNVQVIPVPVEELSGLCLNQDQSGLFAVGDEGALCAVSFKGDVRTFLSTELDLEGVCLDNATGDLYLAVEGNQMVCRAPAPDYDRLDTLFHIQEAVTRNFENNGLEGITFCQDSLLMVGSQEDALLWTCSLDGTVLSRISLKDETPLIEEVAGLFYDAPKNWLWVTDSEARRLFIFSVEDFDLVASYGVPFIENAESVCVDRSHQCIWVGSDEESPKLYRIGFSF